MTSVVVLQVCFTAPGDNRQWQEQTLRVILFSAQPMPEHWADVNVAVHSGNEQKKPFGVPDLLVLFCFLPELGQVRASFWSRCSRFSSTWFFLRWSIRQRRAPFPVPLLWQMPFMITKCFDWSKLFHAVRVRNYFSNVFFHSISKLKTKSFLWGATFQP